MLNAVGVTEFRKSPVKRFHETNRKPLAVLANNKVEFFCLTPEEYEDLRLGRAAMKASKDDVVRVTLDDL